MRKLFASATLALAACSTSVSFPAPDAAPDASVPAPTCTDGVKNASETDVDCGGGSGLGGTGCPACGGGRRCVAPGDCSSGVCKAGLCQPPSCTDGLKNGAETGIDCGGGACPGCAVCLACKVDTDCDTTVCQAGLCAPTITVTSAVYAANCGAPTPVPKIVAACSKKQSCNYVFEYVKDVGFDPAYGCYKDLRVKYTCAGGTTTHEFYKACAPCDPQDTATTMTLGLDCPACLGPGLPPN